MIGIAIRTFIIDFGLNIMFDRIINNFNTMPLMERLDFNSTYTADGYLDIDDEENITDEQIIGLLKEKRDDYLIPNEMRN